MSSTTSNHGQDDDSRRPLRRSQFPASRRDSPWWKSPNGVIQEPPRPTPSKAWYLTSGLAYTHDLANFKYYWILTDPLTLAPTSQVAPQGPEIRIHGIGTVSILVWKPCSKEPYVLTLEDVLHWPEAPCNSFNPKLHDQWWHWNKVETSPTSASGWRGLEEVWRAEQEHEKGGIKLMLSGPRSEEKGLPRWMVRDIYLTGEDQKTLKIHRRIPRSLEPQARLDYMLAAEQFGNKYLTRGWGKATYFIDGREVVVDWDSEQAKKKTRTITETVLIDGKPVEVTWEEPIEMEILTGVNAMRDTFEFGGETYEVDIM